MATYFFDSLYVSSDCTLFRVSISGLGLNQISKLINMNSVIVEFRTEEVIDHKFDLVEYISAWILKPPWQNLNFASTSDL